MKRVVVGEHGRLRCWSRQVAPPAPTSTVVYLEEPLFQKLRRFDRLQGANGQSVFAWDDDTAKAQQWVGVIQLPGLQVEILPKVDVPGPAGGLAAVDDGAEARCNLLYMLSLAGDVPVRSRDVAKLTTRRAPLSETLSALFAKSLLAELLRGPVRHYVTREENLRAFKGRLMVDRQLLRNAAHREKFFCRYDEFSDDTPMNQVFRATCTLLLDVARSPRTLDGLRHCLLLLDGVADAPPTEKLFRQVVFNRQNERFEDVFRFCRMILSGHAPTVNPGEARSFSLLFDMNRVFEGFIAAFVRAKVLPRLPGFQVHLQARRHRRHLMKNDEGQGVLPLKPDLLIEHPDGRFVVVDTKWKRLAAGTTRRRGVGNGDLYQLFAYTHRYGCDHSVLLFPASPGATETTFDLLGEDGAPSGGAVAVRTVNVNRKLHSPDEREKLAGELERVFLEGFPGGHVPSEAAAS